MKEEFGDSYSDFSSISYEKIFPWEDSSPMREMDQEKDKKK